ncbi:MAG: hypothetical protein M9945_13185 [Aquamicrobium sp.]|uniref:hypothetical protein n=1 Tax=Aquamicrobium sp. TaxID=1872579 RepID=UPI00349E582A|nr:hypothetical protein [Aquamicrobium sp.]
MNPWNRLRNLAEGIFAGGRARPATDDAIYLTETAYRNRQPAPAKAPEIRERYFGLGSRREKAAREAVAPAGRRAGLLARLGLRRDPAAESDSERYAGTKIVGKPHKPRKPKAPVAAAGSEPPARGDKAKDAPQSRRDTVRPALPRKAETPVEAPTATPAVEIETPVRAAKTIKAPQPRQPAPRPAPEPDDEAMLRRLFGEPQENKPDAVPPAPAAAPAPAVKAKKKKMDRGDVTVAALGVTLAAICAVFPWYIFFNQEKFGVREFVFSGRGSGRPASGFAYQPQPVGKPFANAEVPKMELDFFPTATLPTDQGPGRAVPASEQPFPADLVGFRLVHVANGRAMIEDGDGLWVVQRGSRLPDSSRVVSIEQRNGRWVLLTSQDKVVEIDAN